MEPLKLKGRVGPGPHDSNMWLEDSAGNKYSLPVIKADIELRSRELPFAKLTIRVDELDIDGIDTRFTSIEDLTDLINIAQNTNA